MKQRKNSSMNTFIFRRKSQLFIRPYSRTKKRITQVALLLFINSRLLIFIRSVIESELSFLKILETEVFKMTGGEKSLDDCVCEICIGRLNLSFLWLIIISFQMTSQPSQFNIILWNRSLQYRHSLVSTIWLSEKIVNVMSNNVLSR